MILFDIFTGNKIFINLNNACVVGSSGNIIGKKYGNIINDYECVIRMNASVIEGFEGDVGSKCDYRIVAYNAIADVNKNFDKLGMKNCKAIILWGNKQHQMKYRSDIQILNVLFKKYKGNICALNNVFLKYADQIFQQFTGVDRYKSGSWLSTGWVTLVLIIQYKIANINNNITNVYCLWNMSDNKKLYHYWDNSFGMDNVKYNNDQFAKKGHRFITEHNIFIKFWKNKYNFNFV